ncbi:Uncharacterized protein dnl_35460 [Desulfonema limicola]|uniref:Fungal lipase-type domain-containing protein n=1 Tax=Desulfonema limicola TaxID=45656 RepID=A0A975B9U4_9BACT|nr:hypothetical protein [Desulfonema limicola]QTA81215.1 Uncharacterized protein dnl_35460 [Desulfonema limicola]
MSCPPYLLNIDLCILAYQLYHQSVIWPLDPWYERLARKSSNRRDNFMAKIYESAQIFSNNEGYSGPGIVRGWRTNTNLDPVITNYKQLNPRLPAFSRDASNFLAIRSPKYITDNIQTVSLARYTGEPGENTMQSGTEIIEICDYPNGTDHLIAFEGGTGNTKGVPAWSIMGFVLMRKRPDGNQHDVHIVFRGSRSGSAARALTQAFFGGYGNPDWVTDMDNMSHVNDTAISKAGNMCRGFSKAVKTSFGTIVTAIERISGFYGVPQSITVSGHSLGAALAAQFTSAIALGSFGDVLRNMGTAKIKNWPWDHINCITYAQPSVGSNMYANNTNMLINGRHIWINGDFVVWGGEVKRSNTVVAKANFHIGKGVKLDPPQSRLNKENVHEPHLIRMAMIENAERIRPLNAEYKTKATWAYYKSFFKMYKGQSKSYGFPVPFITDKNIRSVLLLYHFGIEFEEFMKIFKEVIVMKSSYKMRLPFTKTKKSLEKRSARLQVALRGMRDKMTGQTKENLLNRIETDITALEGTQGTNTDKYLGIGIILNAFQRSSLTLDEFNSRPKLKKCLEFEI